MIRKPSIILIFIAGVGLVVFFYFVTESTQQPVDIHQTTYTELTMPGDTAFGGLFPHVSIDDSLPYYRYKQIEDSIKQVRQTRGLVDDYPAEGFSSSGIGIYTFRETPGGPKTSYFIGLHDYKLKDESSKFYTRNGTFHLLYPVWDTILPGGSKKGHYASKQIAVRYSASRNTLYIPVSKNMSWFYRFILYVAGFGGIAFCFYVLIGLPLKVIINIARGRAFIPQNYKTFKLMSITLFTLCLLKVFFPYIFRLIYSGMIPADFESYSVLGRMAGDWFAYLLVVMLFLIGKAFQRGYQLQQDQNLTI